MLYPEEDSGPYPADGSTRLDGQAPNVLGQSGIVRADIRRSFGNATGIARGVPLQLAIMLVDASPGHAALAGYAIYLWQCTSDGLYSCYPDGVSGENFLRGVQAADAEGRMTFHSIFPGCYWGRYPHIHFEVYPSVETATSFRNCILTSQMVMPHEIASDVYGDREVYGASIDNLHSITTSSDEVFGDNTVAELREMTPLLTGYGVDGYMGTILIRVRR